jgi:hypothetical protein
MILFIFLFAPVSFLIWLLQYSVYLFRFKSIFKLYILLHCFHCFHNIYSIYFVLQLSYNYNDKNVKKKKKRLMFILIRQWVFDFVLILASSHCSGDVSRKACFHIDALQIHVVWNEIGLLPRPEIFPEIELMYYIKFLSHNDFLLFLFDIQSNI